MGIQPVRQPPEPRVDKWERKGIRLEVKSFLYYFAYLILKPFSSKRSKYFEAKLYHKESKIDAIRQRYLYDEKNYVGPAINIPRTDVAKFQDDVKEANKLISQLDERKDEIGATIGRKIVVDTQKPIKGAGVKGSCFGIALDVAVRKLVNSEKLADIMASLEKGASTFAAAAQAVIGRFSTTDLPGSSVRTEFLQDLEAVQKAHGTPEALIFDIDKFRQYLDWTISQKKDPTEFWMREGEDGKDMEKIVRLAMVYQKCLTIAKDKHELGNERFPTMNGNRVGDTPLLSDFVIDALFLKSFSLYKAQAMGALVGLEACPCEDIMGSYLFHESDESYLKNLDRLGDGVYLIGIGEKDGRHAISLIREGDVDYIIDPNGVQLKSDSKEETRALLLKLLGEYPPPPSEKEGVINHRLEIYEFKPDLPLHP